MDGKISFITRDLIDQAAVQIDKQGIPDKRKGKPYFVEINAKQYPFKLLITEAAKIAGVNLKSDDFESNASNRKGFEEIIGYLIKRKYMDFFKIEQMVSFQNEAGKPYKKGSLGTQWFFDTREKLKYSIKLLSEDLNQNLTVNYEQVPNKRAGQGKGLVLINYVPIGFIPESCKNVKELIFIKLCFHSSKAGRLTFFIDVDLNTKGGSNIFSTDRDAINKQTNWEIKVDESFPDNWQDFIELISPIVSDRINYLQDYLSENEKIMKEGDKKMKPDQMPTTTQPLNQILFGPPGTGKTYYLLEKVIPHFQQNLTKKPEGIVESELISKLPWWKIFALILLEKGKQTVPQIKEHRFVKYKLEVSNTNSLNQTVWGQLSSHTINESLTVEYASRQGSLIFDKEEDYVWFIAKTNDPVIDELNELLEEIRKLKDSSVQTQSNFKFITFHQSTSYENFVEGIIPRIDEETPEHVGQLSYEIKKGSFYTACDESSKLAGFLGLKDCLEHSKEERKEKFSNAAPYCLLVDEINRGNVSAILGELITLIEEDKRLTRNEIIVELPYSKNPFGVPPNLHIIGTMNTADRSVESLDTALRRRFSFTEMPPRYDLEELKYVFAGTTGTEILQKLNTRIEKLLDRDHLIGHSYFLIKERKDIQEKLIDSFYRSIIPLLQEYFFGDYAKIGAVLGSGFVHREQETNQEIFASGFENEDYSEKDIFQIIDYRKNQPGNKYIQNGMTFEKAIQLLMNLPINKEIEA